MLKYPSRNQGLGINSNLQRRHAGREDGGRSRGGGRWTDRGQVLSGRGSEADVF